MAERLKDATSPYLLQHAGNPVDWWPWGDAAFTEARARDVPVLLSVGYSACHWCHVMAHESFEDTPTAALMNENLVAIKVDREERPDVDAVYMTATQAMTGQGGWPMTVFMTPDREPFYCGTYYPREHFGRLVVAISQAWGERRGDVSGQARQIAAALAESSERGSAGEAAGGLGDGAGPGRGAGAGHGGGHGAGDGQGRYLRPAGRRVCPVQRRCGLGRAALREDVVRQRTVGSGLRALVAATWLGRPVSWFRWCRGRAAAGAGAAGGRADLRLDDRGPDDGGGRFR